MIRTYLKYCPWTRGTGTLIASALHSSHRRMFPTECSPWPNYPHRMLIVFPQFQLLYVILNSLVRFLLTHCYHRIDPHHIN